MDWMNRGNRQGQQPHNQPVAPNTANNQVHHNAPQHNQGSGRNLLDKLSPRVIGIAAAAIIAVGLLAFFIFGVGKGEARYVDDSKMQAVFLNGGQVYFGRIQGMNNKFIELKDIYYLRVNQQVQPNQQNQQQSSDDISLVKLGCELHGPQDQMLINRQQVVFWENLKEDGQVAQAVAEFVAQNPNGQDCTQQQGTGTGQQSPTPTPNTNNQGGAGSTAPAGGEGADQNDTPPTGPTAPTE